MSDTSPIPRWFMWKLTMPSCVIMMLHWAIPVCFELKIRGIHQIAILLHLMLIAMPSSVDDIPSTAVQHSQPFALAFWCRRAGDGSDRLEMKTFIL